MLSWHTKEVNKLPGWKVYTAVAHCPEANDQVDTKRWFMFATREGTQAVLPEHPWQIKANQTLPVGFQGSIRQELNQVKFSKML